MTGEALTLLVELQLDMDKEEEAIEALKTLCAGVEANEPGMLAYVCTRSREEPQRIVFFEIYKDVVAEKAHQETPYHTEFFENAFPRLFESAKVTLLDRVGGFTRRYAVSEDATGEVITRLVEFQLIMDKEEEGIEALQALCAGVEANEPGTLAYVCTRSKEEPERIIFFYIIKDPAARKAHIETPHHAEFFENAFPRLFKPWGKATELDQVAGFTRRYTVS